MPCIQSISHPSNICCHPLHTHPNVHQLLYVRSGSVDLTVDDSHYTFDGPALIFINSFEKHSISVVSQNYDRYTVDLDPAETRKALASHRLQSIFTDRPASFSHVLPIKEEIDIIDALFTLLLAERTATEKKRLAGVHQHFTDNSDSLFRHLLITVYRTYPTAFPMTSVESSAAALVEKIKPRLENNLEKSVTLGDLENEFHLSRYYLSRIFHEVTGYSPMNYRLRCRIAAAREYLVSSQWNVTEICDKTGFADMSNFSRVFRREVGCTPTEYRKRQSEVNE